MIREEYKRAFLNEKNRKVIMIQFVDTDEIIDASQIVDQGSFKYTESSNDSNELKLGLSEASSFEIDIKGDLSDRSGENIYVEVIAYEEDEEQIKAYPIPIGHFIISNIDYDYVLDKSHLLCYDRIAMVKEEGQEVEIPKVSGVELFLTNYYINLIIKSVPKEYYDQTPPITIQKVIAPNYYHMKYIYWCIDISGSNYKYYVTEQILKYQSIEYIFDSSYEIDSKIFYLVQSLAEIPYVNYDYVMQNNGREKVNEFWRNNPSYNYDKSTLHYMDTKWQYLRFPWDGNTSSNRIVYPNTKELYKMSIKSNVIENGKRVYGINYAYPFASGYRYGTYTSNQVEYKELWGFDETGVIWTDSRPMATNPSMFPDLVASYPIVNAYKNMPLTMRGAWFDSDVVSKYQGSTLSKMVSDFSETNGEKVKVDRISGELETYAFWNEENVYPSNNIYPMDTIYPQGERNIVNISKNMYEMLVVKTKQAQRIGKVVVTYNSDTEEGIEYIAQIPDFDETKYATLELPKKNFYIDGKFYEPQAVANNILDTYKNYVYTPFELEGTGMPWLESGDWIVVETDEGQQRLNVTRRTLRGIQGMMDSLSGGGI